METEIKNLKPIFTTKVEAQEEGLLVEVNEDSYLQQVCKILRDTNTGTKLFHRSRLSRLKQMFQ